MKGIMFNEKYGLESAVLHGTKTRTWRADKQPRYEVGEIVAIKQCYKAGATNKMFVKNEIMPHQIRITAVKKCRLQDLTDEECLREGIETMFLKSMEIVFYFRNSILYQTEKKAFADLINKLNGKCYWDSNPEGYAYEFELVK